LRKEKAKGEKEKKLKLVSAPLVLFRLEYFFSLGREMLRGWGFCVVVAVEMEVTVGK
jgi:hypothetical protein